jgi:hypothetical protein
MRPSLTTPSPVTWSLGVALVAAHVARRLAHHTGPDALVRWGAIRSGEHRLAEAWRLAAHGWLHVHAIHLALNLVPLLLLGPWIEQRVGRRRLAATWTLATVAGGLLSASTAPSGALIVGASGGSFGLLGFTLAQLSGAPVARTHRPRALRRRAPARGPHRPRRRALRAPRRRPHRRHRGARVQAARGRRRGGLISEGGSQPRRRRTEISPAEARSHAAPKSVRVVRSASVQSQPF